MGKKLEFVRTFDEVDQAVMDMMSGLEIDGEPVSTLYFSPDVDFADSQKEFPAFVIFRVGEMPDFSRSTTDDIRDNYDYDEKGNPLSYDVQPAPEPWNLMYNIRVLSFYKQDLVFMTRHILERFPQRYATITIKGIAYDVDFVSYNLPMSRYKDFGKTVAGKKEFSEQFLYRIKISMQTGERKPVNLVKSVGINTSIKE